MRTIWVALFTLLGAAAVSAAQKPETLPAPTKPEALPAPSAQQNAAPSAAAPAAPAPHPDAGGCASCGCGHGCGHKLLAFLTYHPRVLGAGCKCCCCQGHYLPLYAYFPPCADGPGTHVPCASCSTCGGGHGFLGLFGGGCSSCGGH
jgi:hypothetical protein